MDFDTQADILEMIEEIQALLETQEENTILKITKDKLDDLHAYVCIQCHIKM